MNSFSVNGQADKAISQEIFRLTFVTDSDSVTALFCQAENALLS
jgi:hypothetical protein